MDKILDITSYLSVLPLERQVAFLKQSIYKTRYGQKKLIEPIIEDGIIKFRATYIDPMTQTRAVRSTFQEAIEYVSGTGISEIASINVADEMTPAMYAGYGSVVRKMSEMTGKDVSAQIIIHKAEQGSDSVINFLQQIVEKNKGIAFPIKEGAIAVNYMVDGKVLSMQESLTLMDESGMGIVDVSELRDTIKSGDPRKLSKLFEKISKRLKGVLSPRDVSLSDNLLESFLRKGTGAGSLMEKLGRSTLVLDTTFEVMAQAFEDSNARFATASGKQLHAMRYIREYGSKEESMKTIRLTLEGIVDAQADPSLNVDSLESKLKQFINEIANSGDINIEQGKFGSLIAKDKLRDPKFNLFEKNEREIIEKLFKEMEKGYDGSSLINRKSINSVKKNLLTERLELVKQGQKKNIIRISEIDQQIKELDQKMSQATLRGSIQIGEKNYSFKSAFQSISFKDYLDEYSIVTDISGIKPETAIAKGVPIVNISGAAEATADVYMDPMLSAFQQQVFADPSELKMLETQRKLMLEEFQTILETGRITQDHEVMKAVNRMAVQDLDFLPEEQKFSKLINRQMMEEIQNLLASGVRVNDSPQLLNLITKFYQSRLFRVKNGIMEPLLPEVYRFALNSERNAISAGRVATQMLNGEADIVNIGERQVSMAKFRISNHNLLLHERDVANFYHALGGFDLDDKGLPILGTYMSDGKKRLAAAMVRQPTSQGELIGLLKFDDLETYQELFGKNKFFMNTLNKMIAETGRSDLSILKSALTGKDFLDEMFDMNKMEQSAIDVFETLYGEGTRRFDEAYLSRFTQKALSNMSVTELLSKGGDDPLMATLGFQKLEAEVEPLRLGNKVLENLQSHVSDEKYKELQQLLGKSENDFYKALVDLDDSTLNKAFSETFLKESINVRINNANVNILGVYANRSTVAGDVLFQIEQLSKNNKISAEAIDLIKQAGMTALLPAETPIDMTQTFTSGRFTLKYLSEQANKDLEKTMGALKAVYGEQSMNLGEFGEKTIAQLGRLQGIIAQDLGFKDLPIIDEMYLTSGKLSRSDLALYAKGLAQGMIDRGASKEDIADIITAAEKEPQTISDVLKARGMIGQGVISAQSAMAETSNYMLETMAGIARNRIISEEERLARYVTTESRAAAETILDRNKSLIEAIEETSSQIKNRAVDSELLKFNLDNFRRNLGTKILSDIQAISEGMEVTGEQLINSLNYVSAQRGYRSDFLSKLPDISMQDDEPTNLLYRYQQMARKKRMYEESVRNAELRGIVERMNLDETTIAKIVSQQGEIDFAEAFANSGGANYTDYNLVSDIMSGNQVDAEAPGVQNAKSIADAVTAKAQYQFAEMQDPQVFDFINGSKASASVISPAAKVSEDMPDVVSETMQRIKTVKNEVTPTPFRQITKDYLLEKLSNPNIRNAAIGTGLAVVGSFIYQNKKDRSVDDAGGPPLLPGGSAYEQGYPMRLSEIGNMSGQRYTPGMNYKVSLYGNRGDVEKFQQAASGLTNGNINSTMYNRIPDVGSNPYQQFAMSF